MKLRITAHAIRSLSALLAAAPLLAYPANPEKVRFRSGDSFVIGDLYTPAGVHTVQKFPAVIVGGSLSSVKEMMAAAYARELAGRGIIALAIDYRHYGESGGEPRQYEDPDEKVEDLSAAITYLQSRPDVARVGLLGVCTSGGNVLCAAAKDRRVGAVATVAAHLPEPAILGTVPVYGGAVAVERHRADGRAARERYEHTGENTLIKCYHNTDSTAAHVGDFDYYLDPRRGGGIPQWQNAFAVMGWEKWLNFDPVSQAPNVTAPTLMVHSDGCALPDQARKVFGLLRGPKTLHWTKGDHFSFYDGDKVVEAATVAAEHFRRYLDSAAGAGER